MLGRRSSFPDRFGHGGVADCQRGVAIRQRRCGQFCTGGTQLSGDFLLQARSQALERALQPLVKLHQVALSIECVSFFGVERLDYTASTSIGTVV